MGVALQQRLHRDGSQHASVAPALSGTHREPQALRRFFCIGIVLHAVASAVTSDLSVKSSIQMYENQSHETSSLSRTVEIFFTVFFGIEVGLRIAGLEGEFFAGSDWKWNLSDFCVVLVSTSYLVLPGTFSNSSVGLVEVPPFVHGLSEEKARLLLDLS